MAVTKSIDEATRNILDFLIKKYPPSKNKIVDTELANKIREVNRQSDLANDILRNSGMNFSDDTGKRDFTREIKLWINRLIEHTKVFYPRFKKQMTVLFTNK